ncbi:AEC family transporter [Methylomagnum ishizawai]|uniref:AEC family transporter n=1 Tax=Methylomagnum ishizawai TaxID=1760988 RepID=UPI001C3439E0|nr:AEC family transporter [Methylomagnum ishizawai]BBL74633.1 transporter [Methylomagnum ishizawai]
MVEVLMQMGALILCGAAWRIIRPGGVDADLARRVLTTLVFNFSLPALVLTVLWQADLGRQTLGIALFGLGTVLAGVVAAWLLFTLLRVQPRRRGAAILAVAFANVTYMGLPVLEHIFGPWARAVAIQLDLFANTPLLLGLGALIARHYGTAETQGEGLLRPLLVNPPLWAALLAVGLDAYGVAEPTWLARPLQLLASPVVPLMLLALGLGLRWDAWNPRNLPTAALVMALKLMAMPLCGLWLGRWLDFQGGTYQALVLESAMPSMLLGVVYCDRYRLDTAFYALAVLLTTLGAMLSLPYWHGQAALAG